MTPHAAQSQPTVGVSSAAAGSTNCPTPALPFEIPPRRLGRTRLRAERVGDFRAYCRATTVRPAVRECTFATIDGDELAAHMAVHGVRPLKPAGPLKPTPWVAPSQKDWTPKPWGIGTVVEFSDQAHETRTGTVWSLGPPGAATRWVIPHQPEGDESALLVRAERRTRRGYVLQTWTHAQGRAFAHRHRALAAAGAYVRTYTGDPDTPVECRPVITHLPTCSRLDDLPAGELAGEHTNLTPLLRQLVTFASPVRWCGVCLGDPASTPALDV